MDFSASFKVDTTRTLTFVPFISTSASLERWFLSTPRNGLKSIFSSVSCVTNSYAVRTAASATPPDAPNIVAAPVY